MLKRIVSIGNGTGQAAILKGLVEIEGVDITALVTTTDNGGSSALIRDSLGIPSPGDVRNVINAINPKSGILSKLLNYRFQEGELTGTHVGNLIVGALSRIQGNYLEGIKSLNRLLNLPARVYPVSNHSTQVCAELVDGSEYCGEWEIINRDKQDLAVKKYFLKDTFPAIDEGLAAIRDADLIVVCPGVLGTGIIATLLFEGMQKAIMYSDAKLLYICNAMTYPSQTDGYSVSGHVNLLEEYTGRKIDILMANTMVPPDDVLEQYAKTGSDFVELDRSNIREDIEIIAEKLLIDYANHGEQELDRAKGKGQQVGLHWIRHDSHKIAQIIQSLL